VDCPTFYNNFFFNLLWTWKTPKIDFDKLLMFQKVNHFPRARELCRKDNLKKHLDRLLLLRGYKHAQHFHIMPKTFVLPAEYLAFVETFARETSKYGVRNDEQSIWIIKPLSMSRGRGIRLIDNIADINYSDALIAQRYVTNPLLLDGHKFDLRLYVLVTSFQPLEAFIYKEGFARLASVPFSLDDLGDKFVHLTNSAIQKFAKAVPKVCTEGGIFGGCKLSLTRLWAKLRGVGIDTAALWTKVIEVVVKTLVVVEDAVGHQQNSFEVYGFDVMFDTDLKCWLIECNASPSMSTDTPLDVAIKPPMLADTIALVNPLPFDRRYLARILERRLQSGHFGRRAPRNREDQRDQVDHTMQRLLRGVAPRVYGELPEAIGCYERIAPSPFHDKIVRMKRAAFKTPPSHRETLSHIVV
jgi:tubulin polyglutamylase TTLL5